MNYKYNKGEWTEFYTFLHILETGFIYSANENMEKQHDIKYNVISIFNCGLEYIRKEDTNEIVHTFENVEYRCSITEIKEFNKRLLDTIIKTSRTFTVPDVEYILDKLHITSLKAPSNLKGDLKLKIHDTFTNTNQILYFSVKSYIGSPPTLLNASSATAIDFKISPELTEAEMDKVNSMSSKKVADRMNEIKKLGSSFEYINILSPIFKRNLQMIDYKLPEILSSICLNSYHVTGRKISESIDFFSKNNPYLDKDLIIYKIRQLLIAVSLGMVPNTIWKGVDEATGGYIIVKKNGEVLCYHLYSRNRLSDYLFKNTKFDTPASKVNKKGSPKIGFIYINPLTNEQTFRINIHIRFT